MIKGKVDSPCISGVNDMFGQGCATEVTIEQRTVVSSSLNSSFFPISLQISFFHFVIESRGQNVEQHHGYTLQVSCILSVILM